MGRVATHRHSALRSRQHPDLAKAVIALVGLPGTGKSTLGRQLARRRELPFFDSDAVIEHHLGMSIRSFFEAEGEAAFRDHEAEVIDTLTRGPSAVLATGGGAVLRPVNRQHLRQRCTVIYLRSSPEQLYRRLRHDTKRPLLQGGNAFEKLQTLYAERDPLYRECAHFVIDTPGSTLSMLVNRILMQLELMPPPSADAG